MREDEATDDRQTELDKSIDVITEEVLVAMRPIGPVPRRGPVGGLDLIRPALLNRSEPMPRLQIPEDQLAHFCGRHRVCKLSLFGSLLKGTARPDSAVDLLVEFEPGCTPGLIRLAAMENELSAMLGRKVDLRTPADLSRHFRDEVIRTAEVQYVA